MSHQTDPVGYAAGNRLLAFACIPLFLLMAVPATAQVVIDQGERLDSDRPEAWAMAYMSAATLFSGFGPARSSEPWSLSLGVEAGHIPHVSTRKRRVGFDGTKLEDLNKSPVFGAVRVGLTLPADFALELGWTPPIEMDGAKPRNLFGIALERPLFEGDHWRSAARVFYQRGTVRGDITCDRDTASHPIGSPQNPFGCRAPSNDRFRINHHGLELAAARQFADTGFEPYLSYTLTRMTPRTQVDAHTFSVIDRSLLTTRLTTHTATAGLVYRPGNQWELLGALAWTPLHSRRPPDDNRSTHDLYSARLMLRRWFR